MQRLTRWPGSRLPPPADRLITDRALARTVHLVGRYPGWWLRFHRLPRTAVFQAAPVAFVWMETACRYRRPLLRGQRRLARACFHTGLLLPVELRHVNHTASTNACDSTSAEITKPYNAPWPAASPSTPSSNASSACSCATRNCSAPTPAGGRWSSSRRSATRSSPAWPRPAHASTRCWKPARPQYSRMKQLEVQIMGQGYLLGCPEGGEQAPAGSRGEDGHRHVPHPRCRQGEGARDRIAVLAALNLAFEAERNAAPQQPLHAASFANGEATRWACTRWPTTCGSRS